jgi:hypothetical protein
LPLDHIAERVKKNARTDAPMANIISTVVRLTGVMIIAPRIALRSRSIALHAQP